MVPRFARIDAWKGNGKHKHFSRFSPVSALTPDFLSLGAGTMGTQRLTTQAGRSSLTTSPFLNYRSSGVGELLHLCDSQQSLRAEVKSKGGKDGQSLCEWRVLCKGTSWLLACPYPFLRCTGSQRLVCYLGFRCIVAPSPELAFLLLLAGFLHCRQWLF